MKLPKGCKDGISREIRFFRHISHFGPRSILILATKTDILKAQFIRTDRKEDVRMNKQELIKKVAQDAGITQKQAGAALESALASIKAAVADGQKVQLIGFGTFESKKREAREGRNPRTGSAVEIEAAVLPVFKAGKAFKDEVNK